MSGQFDRHSYLTLAATCPEMSDVVKYFLCLSITDEIYDSVRGNMKEKGNEFSHFLPDCKLLILRNYRSKRESTVQLSG